ncbi:MAG: phytanoyl-CoA dioxygenase family protein [Acidimicrobiales bacterium]
MNDSPRPATLHDGLERLPADTDPDKIAEVLRRDGGLVLEGLVSATTATTIDAELAPHVDARHSGFDAQFDDVFYGANTKRIQGLAAKSSTFLHEILLNPALLAVADRILLSHCGDYWMSQAETIFIGPGNPSQELHRDDLNWSDASRLGIDLQISVLTAVGDYDAECGATMVIPGSHEWPLDRPIDASLARPVELAPGDALVYLGSLVHGGGENRTADRWRKGVYCSYLLGWLTPEEATSRSLTPEVAATLPQRARQLLGWSSLRGNPVGDGAAGALKLWQLDDADLERHGGLFTHR